MKPMLRQYRYYRMPFTKEGKMSVAFLVGLLAGTFFFNMWGKGYMEELLLYKGLLLGRYEAGALAGLSLCLYIGKKRGKRFLLASVPRPLSFSMDLWERDIFFYFYFLTMLPMW